MSLHFNGIGGPTQAEYDVKPAVDVTGNLTVMKIATLWHLRSIFLGGIFTSIF